MVEVKVAAGTGIAVQGTALVAGGAVNKGSFLNMDVLLGAFEYTLPVHDVLFLVGFGITVVAFYRSWVLKKAYEERKDD